MLTPLSYAERHDYLPDGIVIEYWEGLSWWRRLLTRTVEEALVTCVSRTAARYVPRTWDNVQ